MEERLYGIIEARAESAAASGLDSALRSELLNCRDILVQKAQELMPHEDAQADFTTLAHLCCAASVEVNLGFPALPGEDGAAVQAAFIHILVQLSGIEDDGALVARCAAFQDAVAGMTAAGVGARILAAVEALVEEAGVRPTVCRIARHFAEYEPRIDLTRLSGLVDVYLLPGLRIPQQERLPWSDEFRESVHLYLSLALLRLAHRAAAAITAARGGAAAAVAPLHPAGGSRYPSPSAAEAEAALQARALRIAEQQLFLALFQAEQQPSSAAGGGAGGGLGDTEDARAADGVRRQRATYTLRRRAKAFAASGLTVAVFGLSVGTLLTESLEPVYNWVVTVLNLAMAGFIAYRMRALLRPPRVHPSGGAVAGGGGGRGRTRWCTSAAALCCCVGRRSRAAVAANTHGALRAHAVSTARAAMLDRSARSLLREHSAAGGFMIPVAGAVAAAGAATPSAAGSAAAPPERVPRAGSAASLLGTRSRSAVHPRSESASGLAASVRADTTETEALTAPLLQGGSLEESDVGAGSVPAAPAASAVRSVNPLGSGASATQLRLRQGAAVTREPSSGSVSFVPAAGALGASATPSHSSLPLTVSRGASTTQIIPLHVSVHSGAAQHPSAGRQNPTASDAGDAAAEDAEPMSTPPVHLAITESEAYSRLQWHSLQRVEPVAIHEWAQLGLLILLAGVAIDNATDVIFHRPVAGSGQQLADLLADISNIVFAVACAVEFTLAGPKRLLPLETWLWSCLLAVCLGFLIQDVIKDPSRQAVSIQELPSGVLTVGTETD